MDTSHFCSYVLEHLDKIDIETLPDDIKKIQENKIFDLSESGAVYHTINNKLNQIGDISLIIRPSYVRIPDKYKSFLKSKDLPDSEYFIMMRKEFILTANYEPKNIKLVENVYDEFKKYVWPAEWAIYKFIPHDNFGDYFMMLGENPIPHSTTKFLIKKKECEKPNLDIHFLLELNASVKDIFDMLIDFITSIIGEYNFAKYVKQIKLSYKKEGFKEVERLPYELFQHIEDDERKCASCMIRGYNTHLYEHDGELFCGFCIGCLQRLIE